MSNLFEYCISVILALALFLVITYQALGNGLAQLVSESFTQVNAMEGRRFERSKTR